MVKGDIKIELLRRYGYDILINRFEPLLRKITMNEVLILNYGLKNWRNEIPQGVIKKIIEEKEINLNNDDIEDFFEELYLWSLKEIAVYSDHYKHLICLTGDLGKERFIELMDELNEARKKIAHAKSTFNLGIPCGLPQGYSSSVCYMAIDTLRLAAGFFIIPTSSHQKAMKLKSEYEISGDKVF